MSTDKQVFRDDGSENDGEDQTRFMMSTLRGVSRPDDEDDYSADMDDEVPYSSV